MAQYVLVFLSEKGGVGKTTLAALIAAAAARDGLDVTCADLDPRATLTVAMQADTLHDAGMSMDAILAEEEPYGWGDQLRVPTSWMDNLRIIPAERSLANREKNPADHAEHRLARAVEDMPTDVLIVDTPARTSGVLLLSALALPDAHVIYACTPDQDGMEGIAQGWRTVEAAQKYTNASLSMLGIGLTRYDHRTVEARRVKAELEEIYDGLLLDPPLPERVIVREARAACDWVGNYEAGTVVADAAHALWTGIRGKIDQKRGK